eukprot:6519067-Pyramimonas_sp.AAC.1
MLGSSGKRELNAKAADTGVLLGWATSLADKFKARMEHGQTFLDAGTCLVTFKCILKESPVVVPRPVCQQLLDLSMHHCNLMKAAGVKGHPKRHLLVHVVLRIMKPTP